MYKNRIEHDWKIYQISTLLSCKGRNSAEKRIGKLKIHMIQEKKERDFQKKIVVMFTLFLNIPWILPYCCITNGWYLSWILLNWIHEYINPNLKEEKMNYVFFCISIKKFSDSAIFLLLLHWGKARKKNCRRKRGLRRALDKRGGRRRKRR